MHSTLVELLHARRTADWSHWQRLTASAPPFLTPEFFTLVSRFRDGGAFVAEAWDEQELVGALPIARSGDRLVHLGCDYTPGYDYYGAVEGIDAIWRALHADHTWNELVLAGIPVTSPIATRLPALATASGCPVATRLDSRHPYFALPGFEAAISTKFRTNLQRCARKAGGIKLERIPVPDRATFDEALALEAKAWKGAAGTSIETDPRATHLYRALSRLVGRRGKGALYFLSAGDRRIATLLAVEDHHTLYALKIGYDPEYAKVSPGHLMVWQVALDAEARGLQELDFVGRDDEWKSRWTARVHEHVAISIYRDSAIGLARYAAHNLLRPHVPETWRGGMRDLLPRSCQRADIIGVHTLVERVRGRLSQGLGIKSGIKRVLRPPPPRDPLGKPSEHAVSSWVRVKPEAEIRALLDERERTRGLLFTKTQWETAGKVFRVTRHVRRMRDDHGTFRPISRTVLLDGVDCAGHGSESVGCGRHCPMMYRDEWLEPSEAAPPPPRTIAPRYARVRSSNEIRAGLDPWGRRDGLTFMPEMAHHVGKRFAIASTIDNVFEYDRWTPTRAPIYILDGLHCTGAVLGDKGPCDRACSLMWHADWLVVER